MEKMTITYAEHLEDIILRRCFRDVSKGFYVDIGAGHPAIHSVTKLLYDAGWRGINIESDNSLFGLLAYDRARDTNIHAIDISLKDILAKHPAKTIHFLRMQRDMPILKILASNDWKHFRPEVICLEAGQDIVKADAFLKESGYASILFDGWNRYYLAKEASHRKAALTQSSVQEEVVVPLALKQQLELVEKEKALSELHVGHLHQQLVKAANQVQWYEAAPFSWMLRRFFVSMDRAVLTRLERRRHEEVVFTPQEVGLPSARPTLQEVRVLSHSYGKDIYYQEKGPSVAVEFVLKVSFLIYRILRKVARLLLDPIKKMYKRHHTHEVHA